MVLLKRPPGLREALFGCGNKRRDLIMSADLALRSLERDFSLRHALNPPLMSWILKSLSEVLCDLFATLCFPAVPPVE